MEFKAIEDEIMKIKQEIAFVLVSETLCSDTYYDDLKEHCKCLNVKINGDLKNKIEALIKLNTGHQMEVAVEMNSKKNQVSSGDQLD